METRHVFDKGAIRREQEPEARIARIVLYDLSQSCVMP